MSTVSQAGGTVRSRPGRRGALDRALDVMEALASHDGPASLHDLARCVTLPKPTAHRIAQILVARDYARQDGGRYGPGTMLLTLSGQLRESLDLAEHARPFMARLQELLPETVHLALLEGDHAIYVAKLDGRRSTVMASRVGMRLSLHSTAIGKAILAQLPTERRAHLLVPAVLERHTPQTITTGTELAEELAVIEQCGYAVDNQENEEHIRCVGAAVFDHRGAVIGGLSLSAPALALPLQIAHMLGPGVVTVARDLSMSLGARQDRLPAAYMLVHEVPVGPPRAVQPNPEASPALSSQLGSTRRQRKR